MVIMSVSANRSEILLRIEISLEIKTDLNPEWANRLEISRRFSIRSKSCVLTESAVCLEILKTHLTPY